MEPRHLRYFAAVAGGECYARRVETSHLATEHQPADPAAHLNLSLPKATFLAHDDWFSGAGPY
jgi:hypothetical protein